MPVPEFLENLSASIDRAAVDVLVHHVCGVVTYVLLLCLVLQITRLLVILVYCDCLAAIGAYFDP